MTLDLDKEIRGVLIEFVQHQAFLQINPLQRHVRSLERTLANQEVVIKEIGRDLTNLKERFNRLQSDIGAY